MPDSCCHSGIVGRIFLLECQKGKRRKGRVVMSVTIILILIIATYSTIACTGTMTMISTICITITISSSSTSTSILNQDSSTQLGTYFSCAHFLLSFT